MKSGRIHRRLRQWSNFTFLSLLLVWVGWHAWQTSHQKMVEVPQGHVLVSQKASLAFWRNPDITIRGSGKYPATKQEIEAIESGQMLCISQSIQVDFKASLETTPLAEAFKSNFGMGRRTFASVSGSFEAEIGRTLLSETTVQDTKESVIKKVRVAIEDTLKSDKHALRIEARETIAGDISKALQDKLGCSKVQLDLKVIEHPEEAVTGAVTVSLRDADFTAPKLLSEVNFEGYVSVGFALLGTILVYGFVRLFFGEVIGLFVALIASAFGYQVRQQAGYYNSRRPTRRTTSASADIGPILDAPISIAADTIEAGKQALDATHISDSISDAADIADGVSTIFDALGSLSDIF